MRRFRVSSKSQVVVPLEVRRKLGLKPGDEIVYETGDDYAVIRKAPGSILERMSEFVGPIWKGYADEVRRERDADR
jgi:AbrB family looped-hinge helix DNA binding protein